MSVICVKCTCPYSIAYYKPQDLCIFIILMTRGAELGANVHLVKWCICGFLLFFDPMDYTYNGPCSERPIGPFLTANKK